MSIKILIYIGETQLTIKKDNREVAHSIAKEIAKEYFLDENHKVNFSYSKEYYAIILSDKTNVSIDIEKNISSKSKFNKNIRFMQDRKLWTIKECASKFCRHGIVSILKDTRLIHIKNIGEYEVWKVSLDKKWYPREILVIYNFILKKVHVSFSVDIDKFNPRIIEVKNE